MKSSSCPALIAVLLTVLVSGCATPQKRPAANDWSTEYVGRGPVRTTIANGSHSALFLKIRQGRDTAAQVRLIHNGSRDVFLAPGGYGTVMMLTSHGADSFYRGPNLTIPDSVSHMQLSLQVANTTNLTPISRKDFEQ